MYSDEWLRNDYSHGEKVVLYNEFINYYVWCNQAKIPVGVTINFEYADDVHYDVLYSDWVLFLEKGLRALPLEHGKTLNNFFRNADCFSFEEILEECNIKYTKIAFY